LTLGYSPAPDTRILHITAGRFMALCLLGSRSDEQLELATCPQYLFFAFDDAALDPGRRTTAALVPHVGRLLAVLDAPEASYTDPYGDSARRLVTACWVVNHYRADLDVHGCGSRDGCVDGLTESESPARSDDRAPIHRTLRTSFLGFTMASTTSPGGADVIR
jgi:hypothetical protein